jgi:Trk K+ transport system NAD-binding subunit
MKINYNNDNYYITTDDYENIKIIKNHTDYDILYRNDLIDELIIRISETKNYLDKRLMKEDLKLLLNIDDDYIFSSTITNEYITKSLDEKRFNELCNEFISLQK